FDRSNFAEQFFQVLRRCAEGQVSNIQFHKFPFIFPDVGIQREVQNRKTSAKKTETASKNRFSDAQEKTKERLLQTKKNQTRSQTNPKTVLTSAPELRAREKDQHLL